MNTEQFKKCKNCGAEIPVSAKFCTKCGAKCINEEIDNPEKDKDKKLPSSQMEKQSKDADNNSIATGKKDSKEKNTKKEKAIKWWYSMPIILICGFFGVIFIPLIIISVILLVVRLVRTKGISAFHLIRNIFLVFWIAIFALTAFLGNTDSSSATDEVSSEDSSTCIEESESELDVSKVPEEETLEIESTEASEAESLETEPTEVVETEAKEMESSEILETETLESISSDNYTNEANAESEIQTESQTSESEELHNEDTSTEENKNIVLSADSAYLEEIKKNMTEWKYPDKFRKEREEIFSLIKEAQNLGVSGWRDGHSILVKESGAFDKSLQRTLDDNPDAVTFYYYGDLKKEKPDGLGMLLFGAYVYAGNFKKGEPKGYGILYASTLGIICESEDFEYVGNHDFRANGDSIKYYTAYEDGPNRTPRGRANILYTDYKNQTDDSYNLALNNTVNTICLCPSVEYEGEMKNNKKDGKGKEYFDVFQVSVDRDVLWLKGHCYGPLKYTGEYNNDQFSGEGTVYFYSGLIEYDGKLKNGLPNGKGKLYDENGNLTYEGKFKNGDIA